MAGTALVWLRRDLRLEDNAALHEAAASGAELCVVYILDDALLSSPRVGAARVAMMCAALGHLNTALGRYGARLVVRRGDPAEQIVRLARELDAQAVHASCDYTPYARRRDAAVSAALGRIPLHLAHDRMLIPPDAIATDTGGIYTVFTPFRNKWLALPIRHPDPLHTDLYGAFRQTDDIPSLPLPTPESLGFAAPQSLPEASPQAAQERLRIFAARAIHTYADQRDRLDVPCDDSPCSTSALSPYVRWGLISLRQMYRAATSALESAPDDRARASAAAWQDELLWNQFYTYVMWHFPHVRTRNFNPRYEALRWRDAPDEFALWREGRTGYPVVDAAMRQLAATGWMHNRARMITASFLTRHLLIDWRAGERWFMHALLDGDTAVNNGSWQWAAGTGTDAQPSFRIFNPVTQGRRFDPDGAFVRRWLPELRDLHEKFIHAPWQGPTAVRGYAPPMVDHAFARGRALAAFEAARS